MWTSLADRGSHSMLQIALLLVPFALPRIVVAAKAVPAKLPAGAKSAAESVPVLLDSLFEIMGLPENDPLVLSRRVPDDPQLSKKERVDKMMACFDITQKHMAVHGKVYSRAAGRASTSKGMRQDDVMRLFFHGGMVSCYTNIQPEDLHGYKKNNLSVKDELRVMWRDTATPLDFNAAQYDALSHVVAAYADSDGTESNGTMERDGFSKMPGLAGWIFAVGAILAVLVLALMKVKHAGKPPVVKEKEQKKGK